MNNRWSPPPAKGSSQNLKEQDFSVHTRKGNQRTELMIIERIWTSVPAKKHIYLNDVSPVCYFQGHCSFSGVNALWNWCYVKPGLNSIIYFYCILNFLSSFIGVCEYILRISTYLSNTLNARVTDLDVGKWSETKETKFAVTSNKNCGQKHLRRPQLPDGPRRFREAKTKQNLWRKRFLSKNLS